MFYLSDDLSELRFSGPIDGICGVVMYALNNPPGLVVLSNPR
jgi:hypothetical protein